MQPSSRDDEQEKEADRLYQGEGLRHDTLLTNDRQVCRPGFMTNREWLFCLRTKNFGILKTKVEPLGDSGPYVSF